MDNDVICESPLYQMILEEGLAQGHEKTYAKAYARGYEQGYKEGYIIGCREAFVEIVEIYFPELKVLAIQQVACVKNVDLMRQFIVKISRASDAKEAAGMLLDLPKEASQEQ
jgi:hypothetical protein